MAGVPVRFAVAEPTGRLVPEIDTSDADGIVQAVWTLGDRPGRQRSALAVDGEPPIATALAADAEPVAGQHARHDGRGAVRRGRHGAGRAGHRSRDRLHGCAPERRAGRVGGRRRRDDRRRRRPDRLAGAGAGALDARASCRGAAGLAAGGRVARRAAHRALGDGAAGTGSIAGRGAKQHARAASPAGCSRPPSSCAWRTGTATPWPGSRSRFRPAQGDRGRADGSSPTRPGRVEPAWTLGSAAGSQRLVASADGVRLSLEVLARATAGAPAKAVLEGVPATATVGRPLPQPIRVLVTDAHGNPAAGASVVFSTRSGDGDTDAGAHRQRRARAGALDAGQHARVSRSWRCVVKEGGLRAERQRFGRPRPPSARRAEELPALTRRGS